MGGLLVVAENWEGKGKESRRSQPEGGLTLVAACYSRAG
jgi:hypothetical protein